MADFTVIADVGATLIKLLQDNMGDLIDSPNYIVLGSPANVEDTSTRLSLFLYQVEENEYLKNQEPWQVDPAELRYKPLTLDLFYMMTAFSSLDDLTEKNIEEHKILGRAMQIFYDNAILRGSALQGSLEGTDHELRITLTLMSMENITQLWNSFGNAEVKPYKPSIFYQVTPVPVDSTRQRDIQRVIEKDMEYYKMIANRRG
jgi:hypothetical protein